MFNFATSKPIWLVAVFVCVGWVISLCLHEFGHAVVAYWGGDTSVKDKGYLTLNPLKYTDPGLSLALPLIFLLIGGIALPGGAVYINQSRLRDRKWKSAVSAAGPLANVLLILLMSLPFRWGWNSAVPATESRMLSGLIFISVAFLILLNIYVVLINLLPIPSLDGYGIIEPWLPSQMQQQCREVGKYGIWVLIGLLWFVQPFNQFLWDLTNNISEFLGIPVAAALLGGEIFQQYSAFLIVGLIGILWIFRSKEADFYRQGSQLISSGRYEEAIAALDKAIQIKPNYAEAWYLRGYALYCLQRYEDAIACYDRCLEINPDASEVRQYRAISIEAWQKNQKNH